MKRLQVRIPGPVHAAAKRGRLTGRAGDGLIVHVSHKPRRASRSALIGPDHERIETLLRIKRGDLRAIEGIARANGRSRNGQILFVLSQYLSEAVR